MVQGILATKPTWHPVERMYYYWPVHLKYIGTLLERPWKIWKICPLFWIWRSWFAFNGRITLKVIKNYPNYDASLYFSRKMRLLQSGKPFLKTIKQITHEISCPTHHCFSKFLFFSNAKMRLEVIFSIQPVNKPEITLGQFPLRLTSLFFW